MSLIGTTFGDLCASLPSTFIQTDAASSEGPNPRLLNLKGKKLGISIEIPKKPIASSWIKRLVGGCDLVSGRYLYSNEISTFTMTKKLYVAGYDMPTFDCVDE
ncbi:hypothetical protein HZS_174, partial [Henneguya salminicola]